jgi:putative transposase
LSRPNRQSLRLRGYDYATVGAYFVTICAAAQWPTFGDVAGDEMKLSALGKLVREHWIAIPLHWAGVELDSFIVMPNHLHGIVVLTRAGQGPPLPAVVGAFKAGVSREAGGSVWQRTFHDRVIRSELELQALRQYVADNPLRWALDRENPARSE